MTGSESNGGLDSEPLGLATVLPLRQTRVKRRSLQAPLVELCQQEGSAWRPHGIHLGIVLPKAQQVLRGLTSA